MKIMTSLCKETHKIWTKNKSAFVHTILKHNKRQISMTFPKVANNKNFPQMLEFYNIKFLRMDKAFCLCLLDNFGKLEEERPELDLRNLQFEVDMYHTTPPNYYTLMFLLQAKLIGINSENININYSFLSCLKDIDEHNFFRSEDDELTLTKSLKEFYGDETSPSKFCQKVIQEILRDLPKVTANATIIKTIDSKHRELIKSLEYYDSDIEAPVQIAFENTLKNFPNLKRLSLEWFSDEDGEADHLDDLFAQIMQSKVRSFELNEYNKMAGFTLKSREVMVYMKDTQTNLLR